MRCYRVSLLASWAIFLMLITCCNVVIAQQEAPGVMVFKKHDAPVRALAFSSDGKTLATGGDDKMIYLWNLNTGELTGSIQQYFPVKALSFTADDNILAACGNDIKLIDRQGKLIRTYSGYTTNIWSFSYNKPTQQIAAGSYAKTIRVWNFITGNAVLIA